jgi:hypothetical protein
MPSRIVRFITTIVRWAHGIFKCRMDARDHIRHDAASLYRFVETICAFCATDSEYPAYLEASRKFLS